MLRRMVVLCGSLTSRRIRAYDSAALLLHTNNNTDSACPIHGIKSPPETDVEK